MASSAPNKAVIGRAAAVLTTAEVAGPNLDLNTTYSSQVTLDLDFTLGSLTNVVVRFYASVDGVTWKPINVAGTIMTETLTASATRVYTMPHISGWKFFRASVQGTGTVTSSSADFTYRYLAQGSQR